MKRRWKPRGKIEVETVVRQRGRIRQIGDFFNPVPIERIIVRLFELGRFKAPLHFFRYHVREP